MDIALKKLPNGLPVILVDTHAFPSVSTLLLVGTGSRNETAKTNGISHFFEHMAFKGSDDYPTSFDISSKIEGLGGIFNAFTSKDHTGYYVKGTNVHFDEISDVMSQMLLHPLLVPEEMEREKEVIVEEINMYEDMPARRVSDLFDELIFKGHELARDVAGTPETVRSFTKKDVQDYLKTHYQPTNSVIVVAGGLSNGNKKFTNEKYYSQIEKNFGGWTGDYLKKENIFRLKQIRINLKVLTKKTEQAHFCLGYPAFSFSDPRRHALSVLSTILGGGMSSRLFIEVRERRGLCYYVSTGRELYSDTGYIVTQAGVTNSAAKVNEAIKVIIDEHEKIASGDLKEEELIKAKELLKGRLLLSLEDSYRVAALQGTRYVFENKTVDPLKIINNIESVTMENVSSLARDLFKRELLNVALIGPVKRSEIKIFKSDYN
ncbi:hypothetical protein COY14_04615 [Candidatus Roizmanbacteria bacterium CG_4_10_14_0_2_um_filter_36_9]|uniref:Peptidase M16 n=2 Tax=Candidatus Roizmaniibacteriota TaxID=1752723 RepID=A0A2M7U2I6_9BACT|nr:MAG: hypothetical protein COY14_04615 [Candidatus Roizmanbacteria bacterium CG_4_10_14_0_2_um_filter_36_9]